MTPAQALLQLRADHKRAVGRYARRSEPPGRSRHRLPLTASRFERAGR